MWLHLIGRKMIFVHAPHMQYIHYIVDMSEKQGCAEATNYNQSLNNTNMEYQVKKYLVFLLAHFSSFWELNANFHGCEKEGPPHKKTFSELYIEYPHDWRQVELCKVKKKLKRFKRVDFQVKFKVTLAHETVRGNFELECQFI